MQRLDTEIAWTCAWCADPIRIAPRECPAGCGARVHAACAHEARGCTTPGCDGQPPRPAPGALQLQPRESPDARCAWCHDALGTDARACPDGCGVTTHPGCAEEYGGCPTLGCAPGRSRPQVHVRPERAAREILEQRAQRRRRDRRRQELGVAAAGFLILALWWCGWDAFAGVVGVVTVVLIALFPRLLRWAEARQEPRTPRPALGIEGWAAGGAIGFAAGIGATLICVAALQAAG